MKDPLDYLFTLLVPFRTIIGKDHEKYSNHVQRVFFNCLIIDRNHDNHEKYAIAAVFHDIGIWTNYTIDYLDPSIAQAKEYLVSSGQSHWTEEISSMIFWHHKTRPYKGPFELTTEIFRKADWIDVSLGLITYGYPKQTIRHFRKRIPNKGFHFFLFKKITKNFFLHPLRPLPMFKK